MIKYYFILLLFIFSCSPSVKEQDLTNQGSSEYPMYFNGDKVFSGIMLSNDNTERKEIEILNGEIHGTYKVWNQNEQLIIHNTYVNNKITIETKYYENGELKSITRYDNEEKNGIAEKWYINGQLRDVSSWEDGNRVGLNKKWYDTGEIKSSINYLNGKRHGSHKIWFKNGNLKNEKNFSRGVLDGVVRNWYENGQLKSEINYLNGEENSKKRIWSEDGQIKNEFSDNLKIHIEKSLSNNSDEDFNFFKIMTECSISPRDPINLNVPKNLEVEILFDKNLEIIKISDPIYPKTASEEAKDDLKNGKEITPFDHFVMRTGDDNLTGGGYGLRVYVDEFVSNFKNNRKKFKSILDQKKPTWTKYSGANYEFVEHLIQYSNNLKKVDFNEVQSFSLEICSIDKFNDLNARTCSNSSFTVFDSEFEVKGFRHKFDNIHYIDNKFCVFEYAKKTSIISNFGDILEFPDDIKCDENLIYNSEFEFYYSNEDSDQGNYSIYKFEKPRSLVISELSKYGGKYMGGGLQIVTSARQLWKEHLSIEQNMILYGNSAWAEDKTNHRSKDIKCILNLYGLEVEKIQHNIKSKSY